MTKEQEELARSFRDFIKNKYGGDCVTLEEAYDGLQRLVRFVTVLAEIKREERAEDQLKPVKGEGEG